MKTPTFLQLGGMDSGAASLNMILAYWDLWVPAAQVRHYCGISRGGLDGSNIVRAATHYGLVSQTVRCRADELAAVELPCIVQMAANHYVVLEAVKSGSVRLNDPAVGRRRSTFEEFAKSFSGVALTFSPSEAFKPQGAAVNILLTLTNRLRNSYGIVIWLVLIGWLAIVPGVVLPALTKVFVDDYLIAGQTEWLRPLLVFIALAIAIQGVLLTLQQRYLLKLENKLALGYSTEFLWHLMHLPMEFFAQRFAGELTLRADSSRRIAQLLSTNLVSCVTAICTVAIYALVMLSYDLQLALVGIALGALNFVVAALTWKGRNDLSLSYVRTVDMLHAGLIDGIVNIDTVKANGSEADLLARWSERQSRFLAALRRYEIPSPSLFAVSLGLPGVSTAVILGLGALRVMHGEMTIGELVAFQGLALSFSVPIKVLVDIGTKFQLGIAELIRVDEVFDNSSSTAPAAARLEAPAKARQLVAMRPKAIGEIECRNLRFGYSPLAKPVIGDLSLTIRAGTHVGIVGPSGCGKSTLAKLISGLYRPHDGVVLLDGEFYDDVDRNTFTNSVSLVDQDICLFNGTISDNVSLWNERIDRAAILAALKDACLDEIIATRPAGYLGDVLERGKNFSGGERQRLEIARALAQEPSVLILDEATAALDAIHEKRIGDNIRRRGCTCIIIAHRISAIRDCDEIIVINDGQIVQRGTHDALVATEGYYERLARG